MTDTIRCKNCGLQQTSIHELVCPKWSLNTGNKQTKGNPCEIKAVVDFGGRNYHPGPAGLHLP